LVWVQENPFPTIGPLMWSSFVGVCARHKEQGIAHLNCVFHNFRQGVVTKQEKQKIEEGKKKKKERKRRQGRRKRGKKIKKVKKVVVERIEL